MESVLHLLTNLFLLPLGVGLIRWKRHSRTQRWLTIMLIVIGTIQIGQNLSRIYLGNNIPLFHPVPPLEVFFICMIFREPLQKLNLDKVLTLFPLFFLAFAVLSLLFYEGLLMIPSLTRAVETCLVILLVLLYFYSLLQYLDEDQIWKSSLFWLSTGALIYFAGNIFIFFFNEGIRWKAEYFLKIWTIHQVLLVALYGCYTLSLSCKETSWTRSKAS